MPKNKSKSKHKQWAWFRCFMPDLDDDAARALGFEEAGFLHLLHRTMIERGAPISDEIIHRMARQRGSNVRTVTRLLDGLIAKGLIERIGTDGKQFWCEVAEREVEFREERLEKVSQKNSKSSAKRWEKTQQNQSASMPEKEIDIEGAAHGADAHRDSSLAVNIGGDKEISQSEGSPRLSASPSETGEEIENRSSPVHPIDAPQVGEPFTGEPDPSVDDFDIRPSMPDLDTAPSPDQFESEPGSIVEAEDDAGAPRTPTAFGGPAREEIIVNRALDWLKREIDADPRWVEYLVHQAATKSPQWGANVHGERVAHEIGHGVEETKRALAEALRQTIDTSGREIPGEDQQHTFIAIGS